MHGFLGGFCIGVFVVGYTAALIAMVAFDKEDSVGKRITGVGALVGSIGALCFVIVSKFQ